MLFEHLHYFCSLKQKPTNGMKKIITTVSAMTLTLPSGVSQSSEVEIESVVQNDMKVLYASEEEFKGSGFIDLSVEKTVLWSSDNDGSGDVTLGDELKYSVKVINLSDIDAENVQMFDLLDSKIQLNLGTVAITQGIVNSGNDFFDHLNFVDVDLGNIAANWFALVDFDVTITDLEPGINVVTNSAEVYGPSGSFFLSDDPGTPLFDPTRINAYGAFPDLIFANGFEFRASGAF